MSSDKIKVEHIRIQIGRKVLDLTPAELKELRDIMDATFPEKIKYVPYQPITIERPYYPKPWKYWDVSWSKTLGRTTTMCLSKSTC